MWHLRMAKLYHLVHPMNTTIFLWTCIIKSVFCVGLVTIKMILLLRYVLPVHWNEMFLHCSRISCLAKDHLLGCLLGRDFDGDESHFTPQERNHLTFTNNCIYKHKILHVNYTTYDLRQMQDSLNPWTHANFMTLLYEDEGNGYRKHPYWYGWILGVFHAMVQYSGPGSCLVHLQHWSFCGYSGMVRIWIMQEGGKQSTSITLVL